MVRPLISFAFLLAAVTAAAAAPAKRAGKEGDLVRAPVPIQFYLARGEDNACGPGCSEWIAAEGGFDQGASTRLRRFLARHGDRKLPIFFNSPGGIISQAMTIGRLLREKNITAGVAQTVPENCQGKNKATCEEHKRDGTPVWAELRTPRAQCSSACVYAFIGARERLVLPGSRLGIHSDKLVRIYADGRMVAPTRAQLSASERIKIDEDRNRLKRYVVEMGLSADLIDAATKIEHDTVHMLSRDEVARFGIDVTNFRESRWTLDDGRSRAKSILKFVTEAKGPNEFRTSVVRLACENSNTLRVAYIRGLSSLDVSGPTTIKIVAGERSLAFPRLGVRSTISALDSGSTFETRAGTATFAFFESAASGQSIEIEEAPEAQSANRTPRVLTLSTAGLAQSLRGLRPLCSRDT
jgi:hypothetical protein